MTTSDASPVVPVGDDAANPLTSEFQRGWWRRLQELVERRIATEREAAEQYRSESAGIERLFENDQRTRAEDYERDRVILQAEYDKAVIFAGTTYSEDHSVATEEFEEVITELQQRASDDVAAAKTKHEEDQWVVVSYFDEEAEGSPKQQYDVFRTNLEKTREQLKLEADELESQKRSADLTMLKRRQGLEVDAPKPEKPASNDLEAASAQFREACEGLRTHLVALQKLRIPALFSGWRPQGLAFLSWSVLFGIMSLIDPAVLPIETKLDRVEWLVFSGVVLLFPISITMWVLLNIGRNQSIAIYEPLFERYITAQRARQRWQKLSDAELKQKEEVFLDWQRVVTSKRASGMKRADDALAVSLQAIEERRRAEFAKANGKYPALLEAITQQRDQRMTAAETDYPQRLEKLKQRFDWELAKRSTQHDEDVAACTERFQKRWLEMAAAWLEGWQLLVSDAESANQLCNEWFCDWQTLGGAPLKLPMQIPPAIRLGDFAIDLAMIPDGVPHEPQLIPPQTSFTLPACLPFPERPSLLLKVADEGRAAAVEVLQNSMLRLLTTVPGGKVRFTILDPVGLGDNFAAFMHLADFDELMITGRIWTEQAQIEQRLADLTEHMENVFQKYLRNEFRSIQEYNIHAGEVAEPYHILVVANFPANFSEQAARRLVSIATSGPRCGVFALMSVDGKLRLPLNFDLKDLEDNATVFDWVKATSDREAQFVARDDELKLLPLTLDRPPEPELFTKLVRAAGHESKDARRVEVAFERIAPKDVNLWTSDSRSGLDVPLGRAGATKLQNLRLGKGTSQHVLIAGKTGSGKSTFLHILITNAALHYGPDQLEFYLIDFKKGVEFKTYATHGLPHARVIAIESDREFGVSVLERLDAILKERGDLFRDTGVQDLAGYRDARPQERMPRILLVVDEFQEFFVEDDKHSQTAALMLDRLVRQGRAFGIHVLLGSQTLGGAYSLARSTLGQMAVRIALQCSESDAHLILSEDNTAARLLTRPGEAIYNDANGLVEGNHPFQIAWLPDSRRDVHLNRIQELTARREIRMPSAIIFEGNIPADPRRNNDLEALVDTPLWDAPQQQQIAWLGEAVAIKDPTTVSFHQQGGQNLLIVGQAEPAAVGMLAAGIVSLACQLPPVVSHTTHEQVSSTERAIEGEVEEEDFTTETRRHEEGPGTEGREQQTRERNQAGCAQFIILDGSIGNAVSSQTWLQLQQVLPHEMRIGDPRDVPEILTGLAAEMSRREKSASRDHAPIFVVVFNVGRFRDLRKSDDDFGFSMSSGGEKKVSPSKMFLDLLKNGPGLGIHWLIWSDTYNNVSRWFSSQTLREFELRIVFQMSASDSSNLIDSPVAGRLGTNRAILHMVDQGSNEKFRPYGPPPPEWLDDVARRWQTLAAELIPA
ncbi:MAG: FtsK/SpoIIIE domain-containing protein [Planctomycetia bacterium]|nr:FtsK/SpoIIIE domain-containing protein [Planctomycetia bacterium]